MAKMVKNQTAAHLLRGAGPDIDFLYRIKINLGLDDSPSLLSTFHRVGIWEIAARVWLETSIPPVFGKESGLESHDSDQRQHGCWFFFGAFLCLSTNFSRLRRPGKSIT